MEQNKDQKNFSQQQPKKQEAPNRGTATSPRPEIELPLKGGRPETEWSQQGQKGQEREQGQKNPARSDDQRTTR